MRLRQILSWHYAQEDRKPGRAVVSLARFDNNSRGPLLAGLVAVA